MKHSSLPGFREEEPHRTASLIYITIKKTDTLGHGVQTLYFSQTKKLRVALDKILRQEPSAVGKPTKVRILICRLRGSFSSTSLCGLLLPCVFGVHIF